MAKFYNSETAISISLPMSPPISIFSSFSLLAKKKALKALESKAAKAQ
jgi:hypothetical protein